MHVAEKVQSMIGMTPSFTAQERETIRAEARRQATTTWFNLVLDHHALIEDSFAAVKDASSATARAAAQRELMALLTGHSIAEEAIIYPLMKLETFARQATHAYAEQSLAKVEMVALDGIADKMSEEYETKLEEIRAAVTHHMIEEERDFFPELQKKADAAKNKKITQHYVTEFDRYMPETKLMRA